MGPRPLGRGKELERELAALEGKLQWARDHLAAETSIVALAFVFRKLLQWSRGHVAAETR